MSNNINWGKIYESTAWGSGVSDNSISWGKSYADLAGGGFTGLLDTYSGAAAAYSLRQLSSTYSGDAIVVRRASDNTTQAIGFVNNELDTTSLESFCSGTDGFVTTWYDQSGNGVDATQATASRQPKIVSSGSTILEGTKPALSYDGGDSLNTTSNVNIGTNDVSMFITYKNDGTTGDQSVVSSNHGSGYQWTRVRNSAWSFFLNSPADTYTISSSSFTPSVNYLLTELYSGTRTTWEAFANGNSFGSDVIAVEDLGVGNFNIGSLFSSSDFLQGTLREVVIYLNDQNTNRIGIETNINDHYSIY